jgi:MFS family permease
MDGPAPPVAARSQWRLVLALGTSQTLAWASSYYLPAILADPISASLGIARTWVFGAFSMSLLISALLAPRVGQFIDRRGGRGVLTLSAIVLSGGLLALAAASGPVALFAAWAVLGAGMSLGLYDAAFATLTTIYSDEARGPITGITLIAGFASTVSWPVSSLLEHAIGWRGTCVVWAALNLVVSLPLLRFVPPASARLAHLRRASSERVGWKPRREMVLLAYVFAATWFVTGSMAAHLPRLLERAGATTAQAVAAAALLGPAQVGARMAEFVLMRRSHPLVSARLATMLHPLGAAALGLAGTAAIAPFTILYGAGNGLLTIARGTVPLAVFGPVAYGERSGLLGAPARAIQSLAPFVFGLLVELLDVSALFVSAALCVSALVALGFVHPAPAQQRTSGS